KKAETDRSPFAGKDAPKKSHAGGVTTHWVKPVLVAEIEHGGYTDTGSLRHAAFKGLREDKPPAEVTERPHAPSDPSKEPGSHKSAAPLAMPGDRPAAGRGKGKLVVSGVTISNPDKILWPV